MKILLTGGAGYIGSHTAVELIENGYDVVIVDNLVNSSAKVIDRIEKITNVRPLFYQLDLRDSEKLDDIFSSHDVDAVIHFAGLKAVGESVEKPLLYYDTNINSTLKLLESMQKHGVKKLVFSSSATVYGSPKELPLTEASPVGIDILNPYGWSKYMIEKIIEGFTTSNPGFQATILRYFNPIGAHESGLIGENPIGVPNNLVPYVAQTATGMHDTVRVWGDDYDTPDGTAIRDYIHVTDLARGHLAALNIETDGVNIYNLGTGKGHSVLEVIAEFSNACGHKIPYEIHPRRNGDTVVCYADPTKAEQELGWRATKSLGEMCRDAWNWQSKNP
ncbi:UDP-glucose 4-epimerase GalE, partial [Candidatus Saccharibacteria bacterium]|nr:UDP-glucose 4-epimerase GalE [Candidatus Saccharibacteria bacterium]